MKYSNYLGSLFAFFIILICFQPWVSIQSIDVTITGFDAPKTNFGKPGLVNIFFSSIAFFLFFIPAVWAKRLNLFVVTFNLAWAFRNYLILTQCEYGDCPEKKWGLYALILLSIFMFLMTLFPKLELKK